MPEGKIDRPSGVDVTVGNGKDVVYLRGNEFTDGSIRWIITPPNTISAMQERVREPVIESGESMQSDFQRRSRREHSKPKGRSRY
jgi:hypothetical protein